MPHVNWLLEERVVVLTVPVVLPGVNKNKSKRSERQCLSPEAKELVRQLLQDLGIA